LELMADKEDERTSRYVGQLAATPVRSELGVDSRPERGTAPLTLVGSIFS
jgi:hypothetical protein